MLYGTSHVFKHLKLIGQTNKYLDCNVIGRYSPNVTDFLFNNINAIILKHQVFLDLKQSEKSEKLYVIHNV